MSIQFWKVSEEKILVMNYPEKDIHELAELLPNRTKRAIQTRIASLGLNKRGPYKKRDK